MSFRVLLLTDSVSLPREKPEHTKYRDTWPELLRKAGHEVIQCSIGGATSGDLLKQCFFYNGECFDVDVVIVQCGIVDCAPRFLTKIELKIFQSIPIIGKRIIRLMNKNWIRKIRKITYTKKAKYLQNIKSIENSFKNSAVYFLTIAPAHKEYETILNGVTKNILDYNELLVKNVKSIDINGVEKEGIMSDFHHLNEKGHLFICERIINQLNTVN